jgi:hypothetical protein
VTKPTSTDPPNTYLFSRGRRASEWASDDPDAMVGMMFFDLWATRQQPFASLKDGDNMLLFDTSTRRLIWHFRAAAVTKSEYSSVPEALEIIREAFGLIPDNLTNHWVGRRAPGYVLAWAVDVIQPLDIKLHEGFTMGRNGYLPFDKIPADKRPTIPAFNPDTVLSRPIAYVGGIDLREAGTRYIPQSVREEVKRRDGGRCVTCKRQPPEVDLHFDHKWPFSRGGTNTADNLQLLCAEHNLRKASSVLDGATPPPDLTLRQSLANKFDLADSASLADLIDAANLTGDAITELLIDETHRNGTTEVEQLLDSRNDIQRVDLIRAWVAWSLRGSDNERALELADELLGSPDDDAATSAALLVWELDEDAEDDLLERAIESHDPETRSIAAFHLGSQLSLTDDPSFLDYLQIAYRDGTGTIRPNAALLLAQNGKVTVDEAHELLAVARTADDPEIAAEAAALTADVLLFSEEPVELAAAYLEYAEQTGFESAIEAARSIRETYGL